MTNASRTTIVAAWIALLAGVGFAAEPATRPTTEPSARVLILPFTQIGPEAVGWIGEGVQRALTADLARLRGVVPAAAELAPAKDKDDISAAISAAKDADAQHVIFGSYQVVGNELRLVGQVVDVETGRSIGGLKATGATRDLFALEDTLSGQATRILSQAMGFNTKTNPASSGTITIEPSGPLTTRVYTGSSLEQSLRPDNSSSVDDSNRYTYGQYAPTYPYYGRTYSAPTYSNYADFGYYPTPYYYPYSSGPRVFIFSNTGFDHDRRFNRSDHHRFNHDRPWTNSLPQGNVVTPKDAARGRGNVNGYMPMTIQPTVPRNFAAPAPNTMRSAPRNFSGASPNTMQGGPRNGNGSHR